MTVKSELLAIQRMDPQRVLRVEAAWRWAKSHPKSDIYKEIEWDNKKAAREFQYWQIRRLIGVYIVSDVGEPQIINLTIDRVKPGGGYRAISDVLKSRALSEVMLQDALAEFDRMKLRYERVRQLVGVWDAVEKVRKKAKRRSRTGNGSGRRAAA